MSYDSCIRIERLANGYSICAKDPKIVAENKKRDHPTPGAPPYRDPERVYAFKGLAEVKAWLDANLDKALPKDDYSSSFDKAAKMTEDD